MTEALKGREVIIEIAQLGAYARVSAVDTATMIEATISGPIASPTYVLEGNAKRKLEYLLRKAGHIA